MVFTVLMRPKVGMVLWLGAGLVKHTSGLHASGQLHVSAPCLTLI